MDDDFDMALAGALVQLKRYGEALEELDQIIMITKTAAPPPTIVPTATLIPTSVLAVTGAPSNSSVIAIPTRPPFPVTAVPTITATSAITSTVDAAPSKSRFMSIQMIISTVADTVRGNEGLLSYLREPQNQTTADQDLIESLGLSSLVQLNPTAITQTAAAEVIAEMTAEAVKRATDIAFARTLANATDTAGTQTAIALTPTGTVPPTSASRPTSTPSAPAAATSTPEPPKPSGSVISLGNGSMFRATANPGTIPAGQGDGGSCLEGRITTADGGLFSSVGIQIDLHGNTNQAKVNSATGTYHICGLAAGEWGISIYAAGGVDIPVSEQAAHQVRVKLSGRPGEIIYVSFQALPGFVVPTAVPTLISSPYDGIWAGTIRGKTTGDQDFSGHFHFEVRHNALYTVSLDGPSCVLETYPRFPNGEPLNNTAFAISGSPTNPKTGTDPSINYTITGSFSSINKAAGQANATQNGGSCIVANWNATKQ